MPPESQGIDVLIARLDAAVGLGDPERITAQIKRDLETLISSGTLRLSDRFRQPRPDCYARRLLHRDEALGYTAVVMTWGPQQRTGLHDHAGIWCVEGVVEGQMEVRRYELLGQAQGGYEFLERESVRAAVGSAGCLIPPFEYHVLSNAQPDRPSVTLHVYGGEMTACHVFEPRSDGRYERVERRLAYHD